jgi:hypothetical protein
MTTLSADIWPGGSVAFLPLNAIEGFTFLLDTL